MNFRTFDFNLLRVLDALLRERSVTRAGHRLGLSQPAVSAALARLRDALGDPLLVRQGHELVATPFAEGLALPLRATLDDIEAMLSPDDAYDPAQADDVFRISGSDFFDEMLLARLAPLLATEAPHIRLQRVALWPENDVGTIERYEVDLALLPETRLPDWIETQPLFRARYCVIARREHPAFAASDARPGAVAPMALFTTLGHVLVSPEGRLRALGDEALDRVGRQRHVAMTTPDFFGACSVVAASDLIALVPRPFAESVAERSGLALYEPPMPVEPVRIMMIWHRRLTGSPAHRWLRAQVRAVLEPLDAEEPG